MGTGSSPVDRTSSKPCESSFTGFFSCLYHSFIPPFQAAAHLLSGKMPPSPPPDSPEEPRSASAASISASGCDYHTRTWADIQEKDLEILCRPRVPGGPYRGDSPPGTRKSQSLKARIFHQHLLIKVENEQVHKSTASIFHQHVPIIHHFKVDIWSCGHVVMHAYRGDCVPRGQSRRHSQSNQGIRDFFPICIYCHVSPGRAMESSNHIIFQGSESIVHVGSLSYNKSV